SRGQNRTPQHRSDGGEVRRLHEHVLEVGDAQARVEEPFAFEEAEPRHDALAHLPRAPSQPDEVTALDCEIPFGDDMEDGHHSASSVLAATSPGQLIACRAALRAVMPPTPAF